MLRITKLTDYATVVLSTLAEAPARVHSAAELAERARLELPTVSKVRAWSPASAAPAAATGSRAPPSGSS